MRTMTICAKCSDMFSAHFEGKDYDGYVPKFMPGEHWGDYVKLEIDIETGRIVNWKAPTQEQLDEVFSPEGDDERKHGRPS